MTAVFKGIVPASPGFNKPSRQNQFVAAKETICRIDWYAGRPSRLRELPPASGKKAPWQIGYH